MFVGREQELALLERLYSSNHFEMAVVYGRRRVGKTTLLDRFAQGKNALYFTAQEESNALNLRRFSEAAYVRFGVPASLSPFTSWTDAFRFVADRASALSSPLLLIFDEFPYAALADPSLPSALQIAIDHGFINTSCCMVLCGSNEGFMESRVLGAKSPLYGRRTAQVRLKPFDYADATAMLRPSSAEEAMRYYATFGGTPYYLAQVDPACTYEQNVTRLLFSTSGLLFSEPEMLLRQELREPAIYNSVLAAVAHGATTPKAIAEHAGVPRESVNGYLKTLTDLGILEKRVPFGTNPATSRKGLYYIADPFFAYWFRFVSPAEGAIELGAGEAVARSVCEGQALPTFEGAQFERVCLQWVARQNRLGKLPFLATSFGKWWGTDPAARERVDVDLVAANTQERQLLVGECKWRNSFDEAQTLEELAHRATLIPGEWHDVHRYLFCKNPASGATVRKAADGGQLQVVTGEDIFA